MQYIYKVTAEKKTEEFATGRQWDLREKQENDRLEMNPDKLRAEKDKEYNDIRKVSVSAIWHSLKFVFASCAN